MITIKIRYNCNEDLAKNFNIHMYMYMIIHVFIGLAIMCSYIIYIDYDTCTYIATDGSFHSCNECHNIINRVHVTVIVNTYPEQLVE